MFRRKNLFNCINSVNDESMLQAPNYEKFSCKKKVSNLKKKSWCKITKIKNKISYKKALKENLKQMMIMNSAKTTTTTTTTTTTMISIQQSDITNITLLRNYQLFGSFSDDEDFSDDSEDEEGNRDDDDTISLNSSNGSLSSMDEDLEANSTNYTVIENCNIKKCAFTPSKTSSRRSLLPEIKSKLFKNQTLLVDYKCSLCNLHLFKGQSIDCLLDENKNKFILMQDNILSSTLIANETITRNVNQHAHEIDVDHLIDVYMLQSSLIDDYSHNHRRCRVTHL